MENEVKLTGYITTFHTGKENGCWKAWIELNGERIKERYCINRKHAERTRTRFVNAFWGFRLN